MATRSHKAAKTSTGQQPASFIRTAKHRSTSSNGAAANHALSCAACGSQSLVRYADGTCDECVPRAVATVADLDVAIRAAGDSPSRFSQWEEIQKYLRDRFGQDRADEDLWQRCRAWLRFDCRVNADEFLNWTIGQFAGFLGEHSRGTRISRPTGKDDSTNSRCDRSDLHEKKESGNSDLIKYAEDELKGKQQRIVLMVVENGGALAIQDLASDPGIAWEPPFDEAFNSIRKALNKKLQKMGYRLSRYKNKARISSGK